MLEVFFATTIANVDNYCVNSILYTNSQNVVILLGDYNIPFVFIVWIQSIFLLGNCYFYSLITNTHLSSLFFFIYNFYPYKIPWFKKIHSVFGLSPILLCLPQHLHGGKSSLKDFIEAHRSSLHRSPTSKIPSCSICSQDQTNTFVAQVSWSCR